jgi:ElaB/YqjD/DUF883 family membrane-anchored ribosome-binding protein
MDTTSTTTPTVNGGTTRDPKQFVDRAAESAHSAVDRLASAATPVLEKLRTQASSAGSTLQGKADQFGELQDQWMETARDYIRENPWRAVGIAALAGLIIGRLGGRD